MKYLITTLLLSTTVSAQQCVSVYPCDKDYNVQEQFIDSPCYSQFALSCMSVKVKELDSKVVKLKKKLKRIKGKK